MMDTIKGYLLKLSGHKCKVNIAEVQELKDTLILFNRNIKKAKKDINLVIQGISEFLEENKNRKVKTITPELETKILDILGCIEG